MSVYTCVLAVCQGLARSAEGEKPKSAPRSSLAPLGRYADDVMPEVTGAVRLYATHTLCISCLACCCARLRAVSRGLGSERRSVQEAVAQREAWGSLWRLAGDQEALLLSLFYVRWQVGRFGGGSAGEIRGTRRTRGQMKMIRIASKILCADFLCDNSRGGLVRLLENILNEATYRGILVFGDIWWYMKKFCLLERTIFFNDMNIWDIWGYCVSCEDFLRYFRRNILEFYIWFRFDIFVNLFFYWFILY